MRFDKRTNMALFGFLIFINVTVRYFLLGAHEEGSDTFIIHNLANSITNFGHAKWIIHPLSYFGLTPLSYPCAVPYLLSGISQISGLDMESSVLVFTFVTTFIGLGSAYLMAIEIKRDHLFAFIIAFIYSLSPIFVEYTLWQATTRSLFMATLPLLVWSLIRTFGDRPNKNANIFICILIFTVLGTIHHMFLMLPLFLIAYFSSLFLYRWVRKKKPKDYWVYRHQTLIISIVFLIFFLPQFSHKGIYSTISWQTYESGLFFTGTEKYIIFLNMLIDYWSRTGFFAFLGVLGLVILIYRPRKKIDNVLTRYKLEKSRSEIFFILCLLITIPFATMGIYVSLIFLPFFSIIIGYGIVNLIIVLRRNKKILITFLLAFLFISVGFTVFMNVHWNRAISSQPMSERTYSASVYIKDRYENTSVSNNGLIAVRISSISDSPCLPLGGAHAVSYPPDLLIYDFAEVDDYSFSRLSFDAVILTQSDYLYTTEHGRNAKDDWQIILDKSVTDMANIQVRSRYDVKQVLEYMPHEEHYFYWIVRDSKFLISLHSNNYVLYNNGEHRAWLV